MFRGLVVFVLFNDESAPRFVGVVFRKSPAPFRKFRETFGSSRRGFGIVFGTPGVPGGASEIVFGTPGVPGVASQIVFTTPGVPGAFSEIVFMTPGVPGGA